MPGSSFAKAFDLLANIEKGLLEDLLNRWSRDSHSPVGRLIVANLVDGEHFLPPDQMKKILDELVKVASQPLPVVENAYESACHDAVLSGGSIGMAPALVPPATLGHAINRRDLANRLLKLYGPGAAKNSAHYPFFLSRSDIDDFISGLASGHLESDAEDIYMNRHGTWVTWHEDIAGEPFAWRTQDIADEVRAGLGLSGQSTGDLLVFEYDVSKVALLYRPTVADAALHEYFQPPPSMHPWYGRTRPWPSAMAKHRRPNGVKDKPVSHPEALHEPITFGAVNLPVRCLR